MKREESIPSPWCWSPIEWTISPAQLRSSWDNSPVPLCQEMFSLPSAFCAPNIFKHFLCHLHERWWNSAITHDSWHWKYRGMLICMLRFMQSSFECVRGQSRTQRWCKDETRAKTENPAATRRLRNGDWCFWHRCKARVCFVWQDLCYRQNMKFPTRLNR